MSLYGTLAPVRVPFEKPRAGSGALCVARLQALAEARLLDRRDAKAVPWTELTPLAQPHGPSEAQSAPVAAIPFLVLGRPLDGEFRGPVLAVCLSRELAEKEAERLQLETQSFLYGVFAQVGETEPRKACSYRTFVP